MAKLLFRLRFVPDDEADDVRQLLDDNDIGWFETSPGNWGISMPGIWVQDSKDFDQARRLLDDYQQARQARMREEYEHSRQRGQARTATQMFLENPLRFVSYIVLIGVVLFLSLRFFLSF